MQEPTTQRQRHWEDIYTSKQDLDLSWFQKEPSLGLALVRRFAAIDDPIIDVGAGASPLAAMLVASGYRDVTALDISAAAIERSRARAGDAARSIRWIVRDVLDAGDLGRFRLWHDRAVFHFLTDDDERRRYVEIAASSVEPGGHLVAAAFALDGPEKCSGLPVQRYDAPSIDRAFGRDFTLVHHEREVHVTPWGREQPFTVAVLQRAGA
jgi:SAM-dependent methyltransferase